MFGCEKNQPNYCADVQAPEHLKAITSIRVQAAETVLAITDFLVAPRDRLSLDQRSDQQLDQSLDRSEELLDR